MKLSSGDARRVGQMYDFLREPQMPTAEQPAIVFGRKDPLIAAALGTIADRVSLAVITGGIGKDSGDLEARGLTEAEYLKQIAVNDIGVDAKKIVVETRATNGAQNARYSLGMLGVYGFDTKNLTIVGHATSLKRLAEGTRHEMVGMNLPIGTISRVPTEYLFDATFLPDAKEAAAEYLRLADWPHRPVEQGGPWLQPQVGIDANMVDFARSVSTLE